MNDYINISVSNGVLNILVVKFKIVFYQHNVNHDSSNCDEIMLIFYAEIIVKVNH